ncbi:MAG: branched-chain amino acid ABC transporter permease [Anaerolineae bacterium]|jgi:branched-chain amino acid transport system permease protein|nr:branched-chain amino acid ABC transporter permease [Anaerolineae bacterium]
MTTRLIENLRENWLYWLIILFLLAFPFLVAAQTGSSPFGEPRGDRMVMRGESVRWQAVMIEIFILAILAMSYNLMFGFTGVLSFGHALFFGLSGYIIGLMLEYTGLDNGIALILGIGLAIAINGILGLLIGLVSLRLKGVYFAIFTLAVAEMAFIFFGRFALTRAEDGFTLTHVPIWLDATQNRITLYYVALGMGIFTFFAIRRLINSPTGAVFKAIRENEDRAQSIGYNTLTFKLIAITIASMLAASAGVLQVLLNKKVGPELLGIGNTVDPLLMTIIGGIGSFTGPVIGATGLHLLDTNIREATITIGSTVLHVSDFWGLLLGAIFILAVMVFPQGVVGTWIRLRMRWQKFTKSA